MAYKYFKYIVLFDKFRKHNNSFNFKDLDFGKIGRMVTFDDITENCNENVSDDCLYSSLELKSVNKQQFNCRFYTNPKKEKIVKVF